MDNLTDVGEFQIDFFEGRWQYLCGDDVELELLPVIVCLFEGLNLCLRIRSSSWRDVTKEISCACIHQSPSRSSYARAVF